MKKNIFYLFLLLGCLASSDVKASCKGTSDVDVIMCGNNDETGKGQKRSNFNPQQYQRELEAFITKEAKLTPQEAQSFFPLFREMHEKQRALFKPRKNVKNMFCDNNAALEAILQYDNNEIEIKKLQQVYHKKFLKILPATKVLQCIVAEEKFNRRMMRNFAHPGPRK